MNRAADFGQDRERVRIPFEQDLVRLDGRAVFDVDLRAVNNRIAFALALLLIDDDQDAVAVHGDQFALVVANRVDVVEANETVALGVLRGLLADSRRRATDVERTHGQLSAGFADGLSRDDTDRFAALDHAAGRQVAAVAETADTALRFAGQHRADLHALDTGGLNGAGQFFGDLLVHADDHVVLVIALIFESHAADDAVAQRLDDFARFDDRLDVDAVAGAAIVFGDDDVLRHVAKAAGEVAGIGRFQSRIGQTFTGAVRRDEVLQHVQTFAEVCGDRLFDDFAGRLGHQTAHTGKLTNLLFRTAGARVGHDVNRVENAAGAVVLFQVLEELVGDRFGDLRPDFDDLVVALGLRDRAFLILLLNFDHLLFSFVNQAGLLFRHNHVVDTDGDTGARCIEEAELLDFVEHLHRDLQAELQIAVLHQLAHALLLQKAVDERHLLRKNVVEDDAADRRVHVLLGELDRLGVHDVLVIERLGQVDNFAGVAQLDGGERFHFAHFERNQNIFNGGERTAGTLGVRAHLGQVVETEHHVLRRNRDRRAVRRRQDVVRSQHQRGSFDLRFGRQRNVDGHLVAVEVGVEGGTGQRVQLDGFTFDQHRLERLDAEAVKRGSAVQTESGDP